MLTKYGKDNIIIMLTVGAIALIASFYIDNIFINTFFKILSVGFIFFTLWFFRDPKRTIPAEAANDKNVISPADGVLMEIEQEMEPHYRKEESLRISIFLSPINVHVNRSPVNGTVEFVNYHQGKFLAAYKPKSSELNEHTRVGVKTSYGKIFYKQIVGIAARRIVLILKEGDICKSGDKIGMMKFGSRMDLSFPVGTKLLINKGDKVVAGETIIAELPEPDSGTN